MNNNKVCSCITILLILSTRSLFAQPNKDLSHLIHTEYTFASMAKEKGIKKAFEHYLDTAGIVFSGGYPLNGRKAYATVPEDTADLLKWYPAQACISANGMAGFTSGPFWYYRSRDSTPVSGGYYFSIWKKEKDSFVLMLDGGITHTNFKKQDLLQEQPMSEKNKAVHGIAQQTALPPADSAFHAFLYDAGQNAANAYKGKLAEETLFLRSDNPLLDSIINIKNYLQHYYGALFHFSNVKKIELASRQLICYYGRLTITMHNRKESGFFVQVWVPENDGWKIVADVFQPDNK